MLAEKIEALADAGQHAEREHIDLKEAERIEIVLVPLDHGAIVHRRIADRNDGVERSPGDDKATGMLAEMPRKAGEFLSQMKGKPQIAVGRVKPQFAEMVLRDPFR